MEKRWAGINRVFCRSSSFGNESGALPNGYFEPGPDILNKLRNNTKVLVVGAGGLGCEMLKDLALSGFSDIHVIGILYFVEMAPI